MWKFAKRNCYWGMLALVCLVGIGGLYPSAATADTTVFTLSPTQNECQGSGECCPTLKVRVTVGTDGTWTVNVTDTADNPVPINVQAGSSSETTTTYAGSSPGTPSTLTQRGTTTTSPPNAMNTSSQGAGVVTGSSQNVAHGQSNDTSDSAENGGLDIDVQSKFEITFTRPCQNGCTGDGCTYKVKFTVTSAEGFSVTQTV